MNAPMEHPKHIASLRDFSARLAQRLSEAPTRELQVAQLGIRIGGRGYLVDMTSIGEVVPASSVSRVPWTRPWFRGMANVRGRLVGVYDLQHMAGEEPLRDEQSLQLLVLGESLKVNAALLITRAFGLRSAKDLEALPEPAAGGEPWEGSRLRDSSGAILTELNLANLVADERFVSIGI
ncbi:MAG: chemotaxis protein CheW [Burkholderiaceae bacterium]|jgi:twitching motility protein PilI|nr:chemotaxis protein CheW [Burkholderiaceae bacterium]